MDSVKHPDFFFLFGGSMLGHVKGRDSWRQPRKKDSSIHAYCFPRTGFTYLPGAKPLHHISLCC